MTINGFIKIINQLDEDVKIKGLDIYESAPCRGDYYDFCLAEGDNEYSVGQIVNYLKNDVIGKPHVAYKGDIMNMYEDSELVYGTPECGGYPIEGVLLEENGFKIKKIKTLYY